MRFAQRVGYVGLHYALTMLEYLQAVSMLGLIVGHYFLIRGCTGIHSELPVQGGAITTQLRANSELLDELIQVVVDIIPEPTTSNAITQPSGGLGDLLTMFLNNRMGMSQDHGDPKEPQWEIYEKKDDPSSSEADAEFVEHRS